MSNENNIDNTTENNIDDDTIEILNILLLDELYFLSRSSNITIRLDEASQAQVINNVITTINEQPNRNQLTDRDYIHIIRFELFDFFEAIQNLRMLEVAIERSRQTEEEERQRRKPKRTAKEIDELHTTCKRVSKKFKPTVSCFCGCEYKSNEKVRVLNCNHSFHNRCIMKWLHTENTCPVCRAKS